MRQSLSVIRPGSHGPQCSRTPKCRLRRPCAPETAAFQLNHQPHPSSHRCGHQPCPVSPTMQRCQPAMKRTCRCELPSVRPRPRGQMRLMSDTYVTWFIAIAEGGVRGTGGASRWAGGVWGGKWRPLSTDYGQNDTGDHAEDGGGLAPASLLPEKPQSASERDQGAAPPHA